MWPTRGAQWPRPPLSYNPGAPRGSDAEEELRQLAARGGHQAVLFARVGLGVKAQDNRGPASKALHWPPSRSSVRTNARMADAAPCTQRARVRRWPTAGCPSLETLHLALLDGLRTVYKAEPGQPTPPRAPPGPRLITGTQASPTRKAGRCPAPWELRGGLRKPLLTRPSRDPVPALLWERAVKPNGPHSWSSAPGVCRPAAGVRGGVCSEGSWGSPGSVRLEPRRSGAGSREKDGGLVIWVSSGLGGGGASLRLNERTTGKL